MLKWSPRSQLQTERSYIKGRPLPEVALCVNLMRASDALVIVTIPVAGEQTYMIYLEPNYV